MAAARIGFAGLGRMGRPMAQQLVDSGFALTVYNRTASVAEAFARSSGAELATDPRALAERSDIVVLTLADGDAVLSLLDSDAGLLAGVAAGDVVVDMGTSGVEHTATARRLLAAAGAHLVEAPVSGSVAAAESRKRDQPGDRRSAGARRARRDRTLRGLRRLRLVGGRRAGGVQALAHRCRRRRRTWRRCARRRMPDSVPPTWVSSPSTFARSSEFTARMSRHR
jgi:hypothetical protein